MINWQRLTTNLSRVKPLSTVAKELGLDWQHINRLARGETAEPRFNSGLKLLDAHYKYCRARHTPEELSQ